MRLESALTATSLYAPDKFDTFAKHLQAEWVEEALHATGGLQTGGCGGTITVELKAAA